MRADSATRSPSSDRLAQAAELERAAPGRIVSARIPDHSQLAGKLSTTVCEQAATSGSGNCWSTVA